MSKICIKRYLSDNAQLMGDWNWERNKGIDPSQVTLGSNKETFNFITENKYPGALPMVFKDSPNSRSARRNRPRRPGRTGLSFPRPGWRTLCAATGRKERSRFSLFTAAQKQTQTAWNWNRPSTSVPFYGYRLWGSRACGSPG